MELPSDGVIRLSLYTPDDAPVLQRVDGDPEHRRRFEFPADFVASLMHSQEVLARWERERVAGASYPIAVRDAVTGTLLGGCEIQPRSERVANLSYWTLPEHRGRGIASRAVALACGFAFEGLGVRRLEIVTEPDNAASRRVAIRNGFREAGMRGDDILHVYDAGFASAG